MTSYVLYFYFIRYFIFGGRRRARGCALQAANIEYSFPTFLNWESAPAMFGGLPPVQGLLPRTPRGNGRTSLAELGQAVSTFAN